MNPPQRLTARHGALLVVDIQEKLLARMKYGPLIEANAVRLVKAAGLLGLPVFATEQYPQGLGPTVPALAELLPPRPSKRTFSACGAPELIEGLHGRGARHVTLAGIEAHVCVLQTALDLLGMGFTVQVVADAVGLAKFDGLGVRPPSYGACRNGRDDDRGGPVRVDRNGRRPTVPGHQRAGERLRPSPEEKRTQGAPS